MTRHMTQHFYWLTCFTNFHANLIALQSTNSKLNTIGGYNIYEAEVNTNWPNHCNGMENIFSYFSKGIFSKGICLDHQIVIILIPPS